ncbi:MAG: hypothetical protein K1X67_07885 [Fimbriimonadaceae bacterium]|nr:hypothetical protein [Fimbriimonadaceae bacterium]
MESEQVTIKIESHSDVAGAEMLPDVVRQLNAMIRLLTEFAADPLTSRVEVLNLKKGSPLVATLRVVTIRSGGPSAKARRPKPTSRPIRRLESVFSQIQGSPGKKRVDATALSVIADVAKLLRHDVAIIDTAKETIRIDSDLVRQINARLGSVFTSEGQVTGILEGINVHTKPWSFTIYPEVGPRRIRCTFDEALLSSVQLGIKKIVRVYGRKEFVAATPWPIRMCATSVEILPAAADNAWAKSVEFFATLGRDAAEDEVQLLMGEESA